ncbi:MAG: hypothetical protein HY927_02870 [Elusimicrobia bacterium]|nr:hypothetical protein [Elusimicrobiota bacterium]
MLSDDAGQPATRADIHKLDSRVDGLDKKLDAVAQRLDDKIDEGLKRVAIEVIKTNDRIDGLEAAISTHTSTILAAMENYTKTAEINNRDIVLHGHVLTEHSAALQGHEKRLTTLEAKP